MTDKCSSVLVNGVGGRMGQEVISAIAHHPSLNYGGGFTRGHFVSAEESNFASTSVEAQKAMEQTELIIDFSTGSGTTDLLNLILSKESSKKAVLICSTGDDVGRQELVQKASASHSLMLAPNTSIGILLLRHLTKIAAGLSAQFGYDIELIETHHSKKLDAPSGTAKQLCADITQVRDDLTASFGRDGKRTDGTVGVHAVRGGGIYGEHDVRFLGEQDEILLRHRSLNRGLFASGALTLGKWLLTQDKGIFSTDDFAASALKSDV